MSPHSRPVDQAARAGITLVHQCHTSSLFETVDGIEQSLRSIDRPNFGLIYEPANLEICGQDYGLDNPATGRRDRQRLPSAKPRAQLDGSVTLNTWHRGPVSFDLLLIHAGARNRLRTGLHRSRSIGYEGPITRTSPDCWMSRRSTAYQTAKFLRELMSVR
ncbi:MAG: hypothetical protein U0992_14415 [Planctomycetaceae bacterium]